MGGATAQCFIIKIEQMSDIEQIIFPFHMEGWLAGDSVAL